MLLTSWLRSLRSGRLRKQQIPQRTRRPRPSSRAARRRVAPFSAQVELLEDRTLLAANPLIFDSLDLSATAGAGQAITNADLAGHDALVIDTLTLSNADLTIDVSGMTLESIVIDSVVTSGSGRIEILLDGVTGLESLFIDGISGSGGNGPGVTIDVRDMVLGDFALFGSALGALDISVTDTDATDGIDTQFASFAVSRSAINGMSLVVEDALINNGRIVENVIQDALGNGLLVRMTDADAPNFQITGNRIDGNSEHGINLDLNNSPLDGLTIDNNTGGAGLDVVDFPGPLIRPGFDDLSLAANDDGSTGLEPIGFNINFFGVQHQSLFVNNNGNVTFEGPLGTFTPFPIVQNGIPMIAPFFGDVDTRQGNLMTYGNEIVNGFNAFGVTWIDVRHYSASGGPTAGLPTNTFQMVLFDRSDIAPGDFDIEFNYAETQWEAGQASGSDAQGLCNVGPPNCVPARIGFTNGVSEAFEFSGSAIPGAFLDNGPAATSLIQNSLNSQVLGRYIFRARNGNVTGAASGGIFDNGLNGINFDLVNSTLTNLVLNGNIIQGNAEDGARFDLTDSDLDGRISDNQVSTNEGSGIVIAPTAASTRPLVIDLQSDGREISGNTISENSGAGILVDLTASNRLAVPVTFRADIIDNTVEQSGGMGLDLRAIDGATVDLNFDGTPGGPGNVFDSNMDAGIGLDFRGDVLVDLAVSNTTARNTVDGARNRFDGDGMRVLLRERFVDGTTPTLRTADFSGAPSTFAGNQGDGLRFQIEDHTTVESLVVTNTRFADNNRHGLVVNAIDETVLGTILITGNTGNGTGIGQDTIHVSFTNFAKLADPRGKPIRIEENTITGAGRDGIHVFSDADSDLLVELRRNAVRDSGDDGIELGIGIDGTIGILDLDEPPASRNPIPATITENTLTGNGKASLDGNGIELNFSSNVTTGSMFADVTNNTLDSNDNAVRLNRSDSLNLNNEITFKVLIDGNFANAVRSSGLPNPAAAANANSIVHATLGNGSNDLTIARNRFYRSDNRGINVETGGGSSLTEVNRIRIFDNFLDQSTNEVVRVAANAAITNVSIENNEVRGSSSATDGHGISLVNSGRFVMTAGVHRNLIEEVGADGFSIDASGGRLSVGASGNMILESGDEGLAIHGTASAFLDVRLGGPDAWQRNRIEDSRGRGVEILFDGDTTAGGRISLVNNIIDSNGQSTDSEGIFVETHTTRVRNQTVSVNPIQPAPDPNPGGPQNPTWVPATGFYRGADGGLHGDGWYDTITELNLTLDVLDNRIFSNGAEGMYVRVGTNSTVESRVTRNTFQGNIQTDYRTESFQAGAPTPDSIVRDPTWSPIPNTNPQQFQLVSDPLDTVHLDQIAVHRLQFLQNTGDSIRDITAGGASLSTPGDPIRSSVGIDDRNVFFFEVEASSTDAGSDLNPADPTDPADPNNFFEEDQLFSSPPLQPTEIFFNRGGYIDAPPNSFFGPPPPPPTGGAPAVIGPRIGRAGTLLPTPPTGGGSTGGGSTGGGLLANPIIVNSFEDTVDVNLADGRVADVNGNRSLRAAVMQANASQGADTINLVAGTVTFTLDGRDESRAFSGDLDVTRDLTIVGAGVGQTIINAAGLDRVFHVHTGATLTLSNLTITGGEELLGGGILNEGTLNLSNVVIEGNTAFVRGGGLYNDGVALIDESTLRGNTAGVLGGAFFGATSSFRNAESEATITNSTLSGNSAGSRAGAIFNQEAGLEVTNSTISGNDAISRAGAVFHAAPANPTGGTGGSGGSLGSTSATIGQSGGNSFLTGPSAGDPLDIALDYLRNNAHAFGLVPQDLEDLVVTDQYVSAHNGVTHIYLAQQFNDLVIADADINVNVTALGEVINVGSSFVPKLGLVPQTGEVDPALSAPQALESLAAALGLTLAGVPETVSTEADHAQTTVLSPSGVSRVEIPANLQYVKTGDSGGVELVWLLNVQTVDAMHWYDASVSAIDGALLHLSDWVDAAAYNVFPLPVESPDDGNRALELDPQDPTASPFGWHDTNGQTGAEFTDTRGNNVFAQEDRDATSTGNGARPDGGAGLTFDFALDLTQDPNTYQNASITNLFYWTNILHDVFYQYGFDEAAGNFQFNNYGNGGLGGDPVQADAQFGANVGIFNNAFMATPPDGLRPQLAMFLWDQNVFTGTPLNPLRDGDLDNGIIVHEFGHGVTNRLTGGPANANALNALQSGGMGEGWSDFFSLMFAQRPTDGQLDAYPVGNYVLGEPPGGPGIRNFPYSFDMAINPLTYARISDPTFPRIPAPGSEVHNAGEIWASALWDMNWLLIEQHGYDPDLYNGTGGNNLALQLVMDGLALQPPNPSFLDGRDAILLADELLTGGENQLEIWTAFARRGMGESASDGGSADTEIVVEAFDIPDVFFAGRVVFNNVTITANLALSRAGGLFNLEDAEFDLRNTIVATNIAENRAANALTITGDDLLGEFSSKGNSLIGDVGDALGLEDGTNGDQVGGGGSAVLEPGLFPLGNYGGPTETHFLLPNSPARDAGDDANAPDNDQRGFERIADGDGDGLAVIDIGSVEAVGFGYSGRAWEDLNADGIRQSNEPFLAGAQVDLIFAGRDGAIGGGDDFSVGLATTGAGGVYTFNGLTAGSYFARFLKPSFHSLSPPNVGTDDTVDSDADPVTGLTEIVTLTGASGDVSFDVGLIPDPATVGNFAWRDLNRNGVQDAGEPGVAGVVVEVFDAGPDRAIGGGDDVSLGTTITDADGFYSFGGLQPVWHYLQFTPPPGLLLGLQDRGFNNTRDSDPDPLTGLTAVFKLSAGQDDDRWDAGLIGGSIAGDFVWNDVNRNGVQDPGEPGLPGVEVQLFAPGPDGQIGGDDDVLVTTDTTDQDGKYALTATAGTYYIQFEELAGFDFIHPNRGGDDSLDSDADPATGRTPLFTLSLEQEDSSWDAGLVVEARVGNFVWNDVNLDGIRDDEELGLPDVVVEIFDAGPDGRIGGSDDVSLGTTTTDVAGGYSFSNLPAGNYYLSLTPPAGFQFSPQDQGGDDARDNDVDPASGLTAVFFLDIGEEDLTRDAGLFRLTSLEGLAWNDLNGDGIQDGNEFGLPNVSVTLWDAGGDRQIGGGDDVKIGPTTTGNDGLYQFQVTPGDYYLVFSSPDGFAASRRGAGGDPARDSDIDPVTLRTGVINVTAQSIAFDRDAGFFPLGTVGGFVWTDESDNIDESDNGIQDDGEPGRANVQVELISTGGDGAIGGGDDVSLGTVRTDENGLYQFVNVRPGVVPQSPLTYYLIFAAPRGFGFTLQNEGTDEALDSDVDPTTGRTDVLTLALPDQRNLTVDAGLIDEVLLPGTPVLTAPTGQTDDTTPTFEWTAASAAATYTLVIFDGTGAEAFNFSGLTGTEFTLQQELSTGSYEAVVTAVNSAGETVSTPLAFSIVTDVPGRPTITGPNGSTSDSLPTITWTAASGAASYQLLVYNTRLGREVINVSGITGTEFTATSLLGNDEYQAFVRASNGFGTGQFSQAHLFTVQSSQNAIPDPSQLTGPGSSPGTTQPTFTWTASSRATEYHLLVYNRRTGQEVLDVTVAGETQFTPANPLQFDEHEAYIRAGNSAGFSSFTGPRVFTIAAALPGQTAFTGPGSTTGGFPTISWNTAERATTYELIVYDVAAGREVIHVRGLTGTQYTHSGTPLASGRQYAAYVRGVNFGGAGPFAGPRTFDVVSNPSTSTVPGPAALTSPGSTAGSSPTFMWTAADRATSYQLIVYDTAAGREVINVTVSGTQHTHSGTPLTAGRQHAAYIRALNSAGAGPFAGPLNFSVVSATRDGQGESGTADDAERAVPAAPSDLPPEFAGEGGDVHLVQAFDGPFGELSAEGRGQRSEVRSQRSEVSEAKPAGRALREIAGEGRLTTHRSPLTAHHSYDELDTVLAAWPELEWWDAQSPVESGEAVLDTGDRSSAEPLLVAGTLAAVGVQKVIEQKSRAGQRRSRRGNTRP